MRFARGSNLLLLSLSALAAASGICTSSGSLSWPPVGDCATPSKFDTLVQTCRACCMNDGDCLQACYKAGGLKRRDTISAQSYGAVPERRQTERRADPLNCVAQEGCYKFTDGSLLCLNLGTGSYHDDVGGNGNYYSGVYTNPDGRVQTGTSTATATSRGVSTSARASVTSQTTGSTAQSQATSARTVSASVSSAAAPASSSANSAGFQVGPNIGVIGLVVGLVL